VVCGVRALALVVTSMHLMFTHKSDGVKLLIYEGKTASFLIKTKPTKPGVDADHHKNHW
jgi:hypothetical protein